MLDFNDNETYSSWLMYYLGNKNEDEVVTTDIKLGHNYYYYVARNKCFFNISKNYFKISIEFFGSRLVVPEHCCIDKLGQNYVIPPCEFFISDHKKAHFWTKHI